VKVLDFGLAKLAEDTAVSDETATEVAPLTAEGSMLGTVPYMSPEQLRGQAVDHRSRPARPDEACIGRPPYVHFQRDDARAPNSGKQVDCDVQFARLQRQ